MLHNTVAGGKRRVPPSKQLAQELFAARILGLLEERRRRTVLHLVGRTGEFSEFAEQTKKLACGILRRMLGEETSSLGPTALHQIEVG